MPLTTGKRLQYYEFNESDFEDAFDILRMVLGTTLTTTNFGRFYFRTLEMSENLIAISDIFRTFFTEIHVKIKEFRVFEGFCPKIICPKSIVIFLSCRWLIFQLCLYLLLTFCFLYIYFGYLISFAGYAVRFGF